MSDRNLQLNLGQKEHALLHKKIGREKPADVLETSRELRNSGLEWEKIESEGGKEDDFRVYLGQDRATLKLSTVMIDSPPSQPSLLSKFKTDLNKVLASNYEKACEISFGYNRLTAKVGDFLKGIGAFFLPLEQREAIRARVRENMIDQNRSGLAQVIYDEVVLEIVT